MRSTAYAIVLLLIVQRKTGSTGNKNLIRSLGALKFRNGPSFVYADQRFGWESNCALYGEPENVSTVRYGWDKLDTHPYLFQNPGDLKTQRSPPTGMRSAVPLGGLGTGSFELRADGSIHEWTIENQSPAGAAKLNYAALDLTVFGLRLKLGTWKVTKLLRTHPPKGYPGVDAMGYSGSYPVSKLIIQDKEFHGVKMDLYAYSTLKPRDSTASANPAVAFTLHVKNPTKKTAHVSFMLNLPLGVQPDTARPNKGERKCTMKNVSPWKCAHACITDHKCMSWQIETKNKTCYLMNSVPLHVWDPNFISGQKGTWTAHDSMLTHNRPGNYPQSGNTTLLINKSASFMVDNNFQRIWQMFSKYGYLKSKTSKSGFHGSGSVKVSLKPGSEDTLTIVLGWFYPNRDFTEEIVGNYYSNLFRSSKETARHLSQNLSPTLRAISAWHASMIFPNTHRSLETIPEWMQDTLVNGLSFWRTGLYVQDKRWRQFEALDCIDVDSVHNDFQREIPYVLFYPDLVKNVMRAWAKYQSDDGHIVETLAYGCYSPTQKLDSGPPNQRIMGDVTTVFVTETYHIYLWTNDSEFLNGMWPHVTKALDWMIDKSTKETGLPYRLQCTYDQLSLNSYDHNTFNSFLHVLALRVAQKLCHIMEATDLLSKVEKALSVANKKITDELWSEEDGFYHAWWDSKLGSPSWIMTDSLYAQVWAYTLGLGHLDEPRRLRSHLNKELEINDTPYGLKVMTTDRPINLSVGVCPKDISTHKLNENVALYESIWMGGSPDWTTLQIHLGMDPKKAMSQAKKAIDHVRSSLNDTWNFQGLYSGPGYGLDGLPWCTSHYTFHMVMWHTPFALSGQYFSAPNATLTFNPKLRCPFKLPFYTPYAVGSLQVDYVKGKKGKTKKQKNKKRFQVLSTSGELFLRRLKVDGVPYPRKTVTVKEGKTLTWFSR